MWMLKMFGWSYWVYFVKFCCWWKLCWNVNVNFFTFSVVVINVVLTSLFVFLQLNNCLWNWDWLIRGLSGCCFVLEGLGSIAKWRRKFRIVWGAVLIESFKEKNCDLICNCLTCHCLLWLIFIFWQVIDVENYFVIIMIDQRKSWSNLWLNKLIKYVLILPDLF